MDKKISQLNNLPTPDLLDLHVIVDVSANETKNTTQEQLEDTIANSTNFVDELMDNDYFTTSLANDTEFVTELANNTEFIEELTNNVTFQNNVNNFVSGGGSGSGGTKLLIDPTQVTTPADTAENTIYSKAIPAGTLGTNDAIRFRILFSTVTIGDGDSTTFRMKYGGTTIATLILNNNDALAYQDSGLFLSGMLIANNSASAQKGQMDAFIGTGEIDASQSSAAQSDYGSASVNSGIAQNLVITAEKTASSNTLVAEAIVVEKISGTSSSSVSEQNLGGGAGGTLAVISRPVNATSSADGSVMYVKRFTDTGNVVTIQRYARDTGTGAYYISHQVDLGVTPNNGNSAGICELGDYVYVSVDTGAAIQVRRLDKADLTNETSITVSGGPTATNRGMFTDGTLIYIHSGVAGTWAQYSLSGTTITFVQNITGGIGSGVGSIYNSSRVFMVDDAGEVTEFSISGTSFSSVASKGYSFSLSLDGSNAVSVSMSGSSTLYVGYEALDNDGTNEFSTLIIKPFSKPSA